MKEKKICPFTLGICGNKTSMPGEHPFALYDEKRQCCGLIQQPLIKRKIYAKGEKSEP